MGLQLIFVVETNKQCNSDWIYIKDTVEHFYKFDRTQVKLTSLYMNGKGNYRKIEKKAMSLVNAYKSTAEGNHTKVLYCFDCDNYDNNTKDLKFLNEVRQYCEDKGFEFVWFCKDIEQVYIGKKVENGQKCREAALFKKKKLITNVDPNKLSVDSYRINTSNILHVLSCNQELKRKN